MSYIAPNGKTYKYKVLGTIMARTATMSVDRFEDAWLYSNLRVCKYEYVSNYGAYKLFILSSDTNQPVYCITHQDTFQIQKHGYNYPNGMISIDDMAVFYASDNTAPKWSYLFGCKDTEVYLASDESDLAAYLTAPEVFQIPSFSFSGSITPGQNSSLSQGSCSLASPYTTSFSFEGKVKGNMFQDFLKALNKHFNSHIIEQQLSAIKTRWETTPSYQMWAFQQGGTDTNYPMIVVFGDNLHMESTNVRGYTNPVYSVYADGSVSSYDKSTAYTFPRSNPFKEYTGLYE